MELASPPDANTAAAGRAKSAPAMPSCANTPDASASGVLPRRRRASRMASATTRQSPVKRGALRRKRGGTSTGWPKRWKAGANERMEAVAERTPSTISTETIARRCRASASGRSGVVAASCTVIAPSHGSASPWPRSR